MKQEVTEEDFIPEGECMPPFDGELFVNKISEQVLTLCNCGSIF